MPPTLESEYRTCKCSLQVPATQWEAHLAEHQPSLLDPAAPTVLFEPYAGSNPPPDRVAAIISEHTTQPKDAADTEDLWSAMARLPAEERDQAFAKHGIRWSEFWRLPYWDPSMSTVVDPMNGLYEGLYQQSLVRDVYRKRFGASPTSTNSN
ncbi:hypothetical protein B0H12DRAFT_1243500 [Mycena haematopus]|nr:hypothetical protein B0H12DRAFT_1243500 [Mycena haematopus]